MEERVKALEDKVGDMRENVAAIRATLEQMSTHLASKGDVNALALKLTMWAVGAIIATGTLVFGIVRYTTPPSGPPIINVTIPPTINTTIPPTSWPAPDPAAMPKIP